jgi:hypothetical protein
MSSQMACASSSMLIVPSSLYSHRQSARLKGLLVIRHFVSPQTNNLLLTIIMVPSLTFINAIQSCISDFRRAPSLPLPTLPDVPESLRLRLCSNLAWQSSALILLLRSSALLPTAGLPACDCGSGAA